MQTVQSEVIHSEVVGENVIHLDKIGKGYSVSIVTNSRMAKRWRIASPVIDIKAVSRYWYEYVVRELKQSVENGIAGLPSVLKNTSSGEAQDRIQSILNRL